MNHTTFEVFECLKNMTLFGFDVEAEGQNERIVSIFFEGINSRSLNFEAYLKTRFIVNFEVDARQGCIKIFEGQTRLSLESNVNL